MNLNYSTFSFHSFRDESVEFFILVVHNGGFLPFAPADFAALRAVSVSVSPFPLTVGLVVINNILLIGTSSFLTKSGCF